MSSNHPEKKEIRPITMPGVHTRVHQYIRGFIHPDDHPRILDVGAGHGAFSQRMHADGFEVSACDFNPGNFYVDEIECKQADITKSLPYADGYFDAVLIIEVMEHIHDHVTLFGECYRVLRPGGILFFSTPNILSLKSRWRFLFTGFFFAFKPLDHVQNDGLQHLSSLTVDQYSDMAVRTGFSAIHIAVDKRQRSSRWLAFLVPFIWLSCRFRKIPFGLHNRYSYLTGRLLFFKITK